MFKTKNVSSRATGNGNTSIATKAMIPNGKNVLENFGASLFKPKILDRSIQVSQLQCQKNEFLNI